MSLRFLLWDGETGPRMVCAACKKQFRWDSIRYCGALLDEWRCLRCMPAWRTSSAKTSR